MQERARARTMDIEREGETYTETKQRMGAGERARARASKSDKEISFYANRKDCVVPRTCPMHAQKRHKFFDMTHPYKMSDLDV